MNGPIRAGGVDWLSTWDHMRRSFAAAHGQRGAEEGDRWEHRAARFERVSRASAAREGMPVALAHQLRETDVVVDIGAGTGRHALLFARRCRRVIAVEPSAAMRARLTRRVEEEGLGNVEILDATWPTGGGPQGDVVFSSHVLYGVDDVRAFLAAMTIAARRLCVLHLGLRAPAGALDPLWAHLHGTEAQLRPAAIEALAVLHQLGAAASLVVLAGSERVFEFSAADEDLTELCHRLDLEPTEANKVRVRSGLAALAPADERGMHVLGVTGPNALVWWAADREAEA